MLHRVHLVWVGFELTTFEILLKVALNTTSQTIICLKIIFRFNCQLSVLIIGNNQYYNNLL
jgi:hypothetical protein